MENSFNFEQANYADLLTEAKRLNGVVADLSGELEASKNKMLYVEKAFANRDLQYAKAKEILTAVIEMEELDNEEAVKELVQIFNIEVLKEVSFTITVEITGSVEIPMGTELDEYSFNVDVLSYNGEDVSFSHDNTTIDGWDFTE